MMKAEDQLIDEMPPEVATKRWEIAQCRNWASLFNVLAPRVTSKIVRKEMFLDEGTCECCGKHLNPGEGEIVSEEKLERHRKIMQAMKAHVKEAHGMTWEEARGLPPRFVDDGAPKKKKKVSCHEPPPEESTYKWHIAVKLEDHVPMEFLVSSHQPLYKLFAKFLEVLKFRPSQIKFILDGGRVVPHDTEQSAAELGLSNWDIITAIYN